jgi:hypothetical protein
MVVQAPSFVKEKPKIISMVDEAGLRCEVNEFSSGAVMIDIWKHDMLIVVQLTADGIGLSVIGEEPAAFDTRPDQLFEDFGSFQRTFRPLIEN